MITRTIGSAVADHATLADFNTYLQATNGFKEDYTGMIHKVGPMAGTSFVSFDTSAYTLFLEPAQSAAFWHGVSASANALRLHDDAGAAISGSPALGFTDMRWSVCGLQIFVSGAYQSCIVETRTVNGSATLRNCILHNNHYITASIRSDTGKVSLSATNTLFMATTHAGGNDNASLNGITGSRYKFTNCTFVLVTAASDVNIFARTATSSNVTMRNCLLIGAKTAGSATVINFIVNPAGHNASNLTSAQASSVGSATPFWGSVSGSAEFIEFSAVNYDFKLRGNAPFAVNNGCAAWAPALDIMNRTRVAPHDLGAWDASAVFGAAGGATVKKKHYPYNALGNLQVTVGGMRTF